MKVVIDTSAVHKDPAFNVGVARALVLTAKLADIQLVIPAPVLAELVDHFVSSISDVTSAAKDVVRQLPVKHDGTAYRLITDEQLEAARQTFVERINEVASVVAYPTVPHDAVVSRMLSGRRPFRSASDNVKGEQKNYKEKGYKDFLIWQTVLDLARTDGGPIVFISRNVNDVADASKTQLHEDLLEEAAAIGAEVRFYPSLDSFYRAVVAPLLPTALHEDHTAVARAIAPEELEAMVTRLVEEEFGGPDPAAAWNSLPRHVEAPYHLEELEVVSVNLDDLRQSGNDEYFAEMIARIDVAYLGYMHKSEAYGLAEWDRPRVTEWDWNEGYTEVSVVATLDVRVSFSIGGVSGEVFAAEVTELDLLDD